MLYEMLTGKLPFKGEHEQAVVYSILKEKPKPVTELQSGIPESVEEVVSKALEKDPNKRYQHIDDLLDDLTSISAGIVPEEIKMRLRKAKLSKRKKAFLYGGGTGLLILIAAIALTLFTGPAEAIDSIAVLPLENLTGNPDQEYFVDGVTDELIGQLGQISGLQRVISRTSVMQYKDTDKSLPEIARELKVDAVVEGSIREAGDNVHIRVQLIDALPEERNLWGQTYERDKKDMIVIYSEMAQAIANRIQIKLTSDEETRFSDAHLVNPEVYEAYLKGSYHWKKMTPEGLDTAERYFELALDKDPAYAPAYEGLAWVWAVRQQYGLTIPQEAGIKMKEAAMNAITLDENYAGAQEALALVQTWTDWDWDSAWKSWRRTLELNPNSANAHAYYAHFLAIMGHTEEAVQHGKRALDLDPFNALYHGMYGFVLCYARHYDDAIGAARLALDIQPNMGLANTVLKYALTAKGRLEEQHNNQMEAQLKRRGNDPEWMEAFEQGLAEAGYKGAQQRIAELLAARYEKSGWQGDNVRAINIAYRYYDAGDNERTIDWMEKAYEERDPNLPYSVRHPHFYDTLRTNTRFQDLLHKMNLPLVK